MGRPGTDVVEATTTLEYSLGIGVGVGTPTAGGCKKVELDYCYCCGDGVLAVACIDLIRG
jgi:hypothetical protein